MGMEGESMEISGRSAEGSVHDAGDAVSGTSSTAERSWIERVQP